MQAYSLDLRERIVQACDDGASTRAEVAELFGVSRPLVQNLLRQRREGRSRAPRAPGHGPDPKLDPQALRAVAALVQEYPAATLAELCALLAARAGPRVSPPTLCRALQALQLPLKKSPCGPPSAPRPGCGRYAGCGGGGFSRSRSAAWCSSMKPGCIRP